MGRSSRREPRRDPLRVVRGRAEQGCQQVEGRLSLRRPAGGLLPGGYQSTPLSRRPARRGRPQEEARRRAEARLASLFRLDGSPAPEPPGRRPPAAASSAAGSRVPAAASTAKIGLVSVQDCSDLDATIASVASETRPADRSGSRGRPGGRGDSRGRSASRASSVRSDVRSDGRPEARPGHQRRSGGDGRSTRRSDVQCRCGVESGSHPIPEKQVSHNCPITDGGSHSRATPEPASQSQPAPRPSRTPPDWSAQRAPVSAPAAALASPDEGEGLTPGPAGGLRIEDLLDTVLDEVGAQLEQLSAGEASVCDEERAALVALYRRQPPPPAAADCLLLQRLRGERGDGSAGPSTQNEDAEEEDEFVLQVCTSSQEDEQDPIRFLKMAEAAAGGGGGVGDATGGTLWLDLPAEPARGAPLRQCDLLAARTGSLPCRPPSPGPPAAADVGWLDAAVAPAAWPDWRGAGDILDSLDGQRPRWDGSQPRQQRPASAVAGVYR